MRLVLLGAATCWAGASAQATIPASSPLILWTGRTSSGGGAVSFDWGSVQAIFSVSGATSVWATLNSTFWSSPPPRRGRALQQKEFPRLGVYRVYVNGTRVQAVGMSGGIVVQPGEAEHMLVTGLQPQRVYNVSLWYTTDPVYSSWPDLDAGVGCKQSVIGLRTDGRFDAPPPPRELAMLVVGDSITSGNAMYTPCDTDNATRCDASQSYAGRLCEAFGLNCTQLTVSSKGLTRNCCDGLNVTVPVLANRTFAQDAASQWDWARAPYDAALINLGTNDGSVKPAAFTAAYLALLRHVDAHARRHGIPIFCSFGPNSDEFAPWMRAAMANATALGINTTLLDFMAAPMDGCGHPGVKGHAAMAALAAPVIARATGWPYAASLL